MGGQVTLVPNGEHQKSWDLLMALLHGSPLNMVESCGYIHEALSQQRTLACRVLPIDSEDMFKTP